jgi:hypothetical protein
VRALKLTQEREMGMKRYELIRGEAVLGVVELDAAEDNFPWHAGWLQPTPAYGEVKPLFDRLCLMHEKDGFTEESGIVFKEIIEPGIQMRCIEDNTSVSIEGINIEGNRVSWR